MPVAKNKTDSTPEFLYHATLRSNLDSIMENGILSSRYGSVHGAMEYRPPENAVYLSTHESSSNLHGDLFSGDGQDNGVIVLRIKTADLQENLFYPDDAFFYMLDEKFCEEAEELVEDPAELREYVKEMTPQFCEMFGLDKKDGAKFLKAFILSDGSHEAYSAIAREMGGIRYLRQQGEAAYLSDIPATAIVDWDWHPATPAKDDSPARKPRP